MRVLILFTMILLPTSLVLGQSAPPTDWSASQDIETMQGTWALKTDGPNSSTFSVQTNLDEIVPKPADQMAEIRIAKNRLFLDGGKIELLFVNEMQTGLGVGDDRYHIFCAIVPGYGDGRAFLGTYQIEDDELVIRYPHTCGCGRTGKIAVFSRK